MTTPLASLSSSLGSRLLAGVGTLALLGGIGLMSSRPAHTAGGPVPVTVANSSLNVLNRDLDNPARQPVEASVVVSGTGTLLHADLYTVPAGKRLVIEYATSTNNQRGDTNSYSIVMTPGDASNGVALFDQVPDAAPYASTSKMIRLYADPGATVRVNVFTNNPPSTALVVGISGYLVDVP